MMPLNASNLPSFPKTREENRPVQYRKRNTSSPPTFYFKRVGNVYELECVENYEPEPPYNPSLNSRKQPRIPFRNQTCVFYIGSARYNANSVQTLYGRDKSPEKEKISLVGIKNFDFDDLLWVLGYAKYIFYYKSSAPVEQIVRGESVGGTLDFKNVIYSPRFTDYIFPELRNKEMLIRIDGLVFNPNEAGNYLWGMVLEYVGFLLSPNWLADFASRGGDDEPWEQRAITMGRNKLKSIDSRLKTPENQEKLINHMHDFAA